MAYTTPITFVALSTLTAAQLNSIQSNISAIFESLPHFFLDTTCTNGSWNGDAVADGTYTINAHTFNSLIPVDARAIIVSLSVSWASESGANSVNIAPPYFNEDCVFARAISGSNVINANGIVALENGEFIIKVAGSPTYVFINIFGYFR